MPAMSARFFFFMIGHGRCRLLFDGRGRFLMLRPHEVIERHAEKIGDRGKRSDLGDRLSALPLGHRLVRVMQLLGKVKLSHAA